MYDDSLSDNTKLKMAEDNFLPASLEKLEIDSQR
jgi:hypothetical protein